METILTELGKDSLCGKEHKFSAIKIFKEKKLLKFEQKLFTSKMCQPWAAGMKDKFGTELLTNLTTRIECHHDNGTCGVSDTLNH